MIKQYVCLVAKSDDGHFQFHQEARILLSYKDGMVFIQTDKPIYTPRQSGKELAPDHNDLCVIFPCKIFYIQSTSLDTLPGV